MNFELSFLLSKMADGGTSSGSSDGYIVNGWQRFFVELSVFLSTADRQISTANQAYAEYVLERLQRALVSMNSVLHHLNTVTPAEEAQAGAITRYSSEITELSQCVREITSFWERRLDEVLSGRGSGASSYSASTESIPRGRPRFAIPREQILHLASMSFTWTQIAEILGVSRNTIYRRRLEYGLRDTRVENITDAALRSVLLHVQREFPAMGEVMVWGRLQSMGFVVRRERLRRAIRELDPLHTALRWRGHLTNRRPYSVPGPNSLWHMGEFDSVLYMIHNFYLRALDTKYTALLFALCGCDNVIYHSYRWSPQTCKMAVC